MNYFILTALVFFSANISFADADLPTDLSIEGPLAFNLYQGLKRASQQHSWADYGELSYGYSGKKIPFLRSAHIDVTNLICDLERAFCTFDQISVGTFEVYGSDALALAAAMGATGKSKSLDDQGEVLTRTLGQSNEVLSCVFNSNLTPRHSCTTQIRTSH